MSSTTTLRAWYSLIGGLLWLCSSIQASNGFVVVPPPTARTTKRGPHHHGSGPLQCGNNDNNNNKDDSFFSKLGDALRDPKKALVSALAGDYDQDACRSRVEDYIAKESVLMFSFTTWPFCIKAKGILDAYKSVKYTVVELDQVPDGPGMRVEMANIIGRTSVPAIFINGEFVGGCNDGGMGGLVPLSESGELDDLLKAAGAIV